MDLSPFTPNYLSVTSSPSETSSHRYHNHRHLHLPLASNADSYHFFFHFYGHRRTFTPTVVAAAVRNKLKENRESAAGANKYGNHNQYKQIDAYQQHNALSWEYMIKEYVKNGFCDKALRLYYQMQRAGIQPGKLVFISVINACGSLSDLQTGRKIHEDIIAGKFESDVFVGTALLSMYVKCGSLDTAYQVFDRMPERDIVSWNAMIAGYSQNDHPHAALAFFNEMQIQGIKPDSFTMVSVLPACANLLSLEQGKQIHGYVIRNGFEHNIFVGNGLVDMYAKCGNIVIAQKWFERMPNRNIVSWNAIIAGYFQNNQPHEALTYFNEMQKMHIKPNSITIVSILPACAVLLAVEQGKQIHGYVIRHEFESHISVSTGLLDMYAKCGNIGIARQVFDKMSSRDVVTWNAMILGYGLHGHGEDALALFSQMQGTGIKPNHSTLVGVLTACSHAGLVDKGWQYFECMRSNYGLAPQLDHYACLVDLLGRAGHLDEARDIIKKMPFEPDAAVWGALLGACRIHRNIELGEEAAKHVLKLEPSNAGSYVLLSNIYSEAGRWEDAIKLWSMMKEREVKKQPGCSLIEVNREVHRFLVGDRTHPQTEKIYATLETLYGKIKESGYVPNTNLVLHDLEKELKENVLCSHSEKLAIAFGVINTSPGNPICIMKNLRVCSDCHKVTKFISKIVGREIIVRDTNRFHHFKDGSCSCGDYW